MDRRAGRDGHARGPRQGDGWDRRGLGHREPAGCTASLPGAGDGQNDQARCAVVRCLRRGELAGSATAALPGRRAAGDGVEYSLHGGVASRTSHWTPIIQSAILYMDAKTVLTPVQ